MDRWIRCLASAALAAALLGSCATDSPHGDVEGAPRTSPRLTALRAAQHAPGHDFTHEGDALTARVGAFGRGARAVISGDRVEITSADRDFSLGLRTVRVGRVHGARSAPRLVAMRGEGQEAVLARDGVEERYLAGPLGLEQSYRVDAKPEGAEPLAIEVAVDGLVPRLSTGAENVVLLQDRPGVTRAVYRDLAAIDAEGRELAAHMEVATGAVTLVVDDSAALYPIIVDPLIEGQQAKLTASDGAADDWFGSAVSVSGDTAVVGAYHKANLTGAAYVFARSGTSWAQQTKLAPSDGAANDYFGLSVGVSGDTAIVGAYKADFTGAAYVFVRSGASWVEQAKLTASDGAQKDYFGQSVTLSADTAIVGAHGNANFTGAAYVFVRSGASWVEQAKLTASDGAPGQYFGLSVSMSGDTAIVGAPAGSSGIGAAYVFVRSGTNWLQQAKLASGETGLGGRFGASVSVSGDTAIVGAWGDANTGAAYAFVRSGASWAKQATLTASNLVPGDDFGSAVSVLGDTAIVGAEGNSGAYVFTRSGASWVEQSKLTTSDGAPYDHLGSSISLSADTAVVGAAGANANTGAAYVFVPEKSLGELCSVATECASGFCADGVCCDSACAAGPCDACSVTAGAPVDGTCTPLTGPACDDGDACTQTDACQSGVCTGASPVTCVAQDECHDVGSCDPGTGQCSTPAKPDGTPCATGTCMSGTCSSSTSSSSSSSSSSNSSSSNSSSSSSGSSSSSSSNSSSSSSGSSSSGSSSSSSSGTSSGGGTGGAGGGMSTSSGGEGGAIVFGGCGCAVVGEGDDEAGGWIAALGFALVLHRLVRRPGRCPRASVL